MDRDAIDRIIDAAGAEHYRKRKSRADLGRELDWAGTWYRSNDHLQESSTAREKRLSSVLKTAKRLQLGLDRLKDHDLSTKPPTKELVRLVQQVEAALTPPAPEPEWGREAASQIVEELHLNQRSAFGWLCGVKLPSIFERFFTVPAGFSRGRGAKAGGPYIRFADQVLKELAIRNRGKPFQAEAIAQAFADARKGRSRRTPGGEG